MVNTNGSPPLVGLSRRQFIAAIGLGVTGVGGILAAEWLFTDGKSVEISSPDDRVTVVIKSVRGAPNFTVSVDGSIIIRNSSLGLRFQDNNIDIESLVISSVMRDSKSETWQPTWESNQPVHNKYEEATIMFKSPTRNGKLGIIFRVFNNGLGFRYIIPDKSFGDDHIIDELTQFSFPGEYRIWHPTSNGTKIHGPTDLENLQRATTPVTMEAEGEIRPRYLAIHEAAVFNASIMSLSNVGQNTLESKLSSEIPFQPPYRTPWRALLFGDRPGDLLESDVIINLNPPTRIDDTSWIQPGISTWDWRIRGATVNNFTYSLNTESVKRLIEFSSNEGFNYVLIDAGWYGNERDPDSNPTEARPGIDIKNIIKFARANDVGILLYVNDIAFREYDINTILTTFKDWGAAGIKHGFLKGTQYSDVKLVEKLLQETAKRKLVYNVHEAYKPTGEHRTYPHFLTREFVQSTADGRPQGYASPKYRVTIPFVNMLGGPLDVTPGLFSINAIDSRDHIQQSIHSTVIAQLAQCVVIQTGILHLPDLPEAYKSKTDLLAFIQALPPMEWDEIHVLNSKIGSFVSVARRSGKSWFIGCLNDATRREITIPLVFLSENTVYEATIYSDGQNAHYENNPEEYNIRERELTAKESLTGELAPGGGLAVKLAPK